MSVVTYQTFDCRNPDAGITNRWKHADSLDEVRSIIGKEVEKYDIQKIVFRGEDVTKTLFDTHDAYCVCNECMKDVPDGWHEYEKRVRQLESEGLTRSDAQGVADLEFNK